MDWSKFAGQFLATILYVILGLVFITLAVVVINRALPFSLRKEIEEDQNVSLAILIGSVIIGIAMIVAAAIHGS